MLLFGRTRRKATRPPPIGSRLPPATAHESHSHSPRRRPGMVPLERPSSRDIETFQNLLNAETFSDLKSDPVTKPSVLSATKKATPTSSAAYEDPFLCPTGSTRHWRMQMRSSSHDIPMFDNTSNNSGAPTEMSGLSFPKANFLKHMREANPEEIVEALSPVRKERLLEVLSASQSPVRAPHPPTNTPCGTAHGSRTPSLTDRLTTLVAPSGEGTFHGDAEEEFWAKALRKRDCSDGHGDARSGRKDKSSKIDGSSEPPPNCSETARRSSLAPLAGRSSSLRITRQRSMSTVSKRKRGSLSPSIKISTPGSMIHVVIDSTPASPRGQKALGQKCGTLSDGEILWHGR